MLYRLLADVITVVHFVFVLFVVAGGIAVLKWPRLAWLHVPAAVWGALIEFTGWGCPLTPLENHLRALGGEAGYEGSFLAHYLLPILYPAALTAQVQILLGLGVVVINVGFYGWMFARARSRSDSSSPDAPHKKSAASRDALHK